MNQKTPILNSIRRSSLIKRAFAYIASFTLIFQSAVSAYATPLPSRVIERDLSTNPLFERVLNNSDVLYATSNYIEQSAPQATNLSSFYRQIFADHKTLLGQPTYVPIAVGDITTILPIYEKPKHAGTSLVQARYIREQVQHLLGRNIIDGEVYANEAQQINQLYANAINYIRSEKPADVQFGQALGLQQDGSGLSEDIIWPEYHTVFGEKILVPVVYLTSATVAARKVAEHRVELNEGGFFGQLNINGVEVRSARDAFLNVAGDLLNNRGSITSSGDLKIVASGQVNNVSGVIRAEGDLSIGAHTIRNETLIHRYDFGGKQGGRFGEIAEFSSNSGDVTLRSYNDILVLGGIVNAGQNITFAADGNIYIGPVQYTESETTRGKGWKRSRSLTHSLTSTLSADQALELIASGQIKIDAAELIADEGHISLLAGMGVTVQSALSTTHGTYKKGSTREETYKTVAMRALLDAGEGITIHADFGDITLNAADITSRTGTSVTAASGGVNLLVTRENDHYSYSSVKKSLFTVKTIDRGHDIETVLQNTIVGGLSVDALSGIQIEYEGDPDLDLAGQLDKLEVMPGLEWIAEIRKDIDPEAWQAVAGRYKEWNKTNTSLSPAAIAVIAIVVTVVTAGAAAGALGAASATATTAATSASIAGSTTLGAAAVAASTSLATAASIAAANALVNGEGLDGAIDSAFEAVTDDETLKSAAVAAVTAGAISALNADFFNVGGKEFSFGEQAVQAATHAAVRAGVSTLAYDTDFNDAFTQSLVSSATSELGRHMAETIGKTFDVADPEVWQTTLKYVSHAAVGCVIGAANSTVTEANSEQSCYAQGAGAVVGEYIGGQFRESDKVNETKDEIEAFLNEQKELAERFASGEFDQADFQSYLDSPRMTQYYRSRLAGFRAQGADLAKLGAAFTALIAGADAAGVNAAAAGAHNAAYYNSLRYFEDISIALQTAAIDVYESFKNAQGPFERLGAYLSDNLASEMVEWAVKTEEQILVEADSSQYAKLLIALRDTNVANNPFRNLELHKVAAVLAGVIDIGAGMGGTLDILVRVALSEGSVGQDLVAAAALAAGVSEGELGLISESIDEFDVANAESIRGSINEITELVENLNQVYASAQDLLIKAGLEGDLQAEADVIRALTALSLPVVLGAASGGTGVGVLATTTRNALIRLRSVLNRTDLDTNALNQILPDHIRVVDTDGDTRPDNVEVRQPRVEEASPSAWRTEEPDFKYPSNGGAGGQSNPLNAPKLEPDSLYEVDGRYYYRTDANGDVIQGGGELELTPGARSKHQQCIVGDCGLPTDEGGHLIGTQFNGPGARINLEPQDWRLNRGRGSPWAEMERQWAGALVENLKVTVDIRVERSSPGARPDRFIVSYKIETPDGLIIDEVLDRSFRNRPGG